jgi:alpha-beta hydrolase superfamily lysophospholipase
MHRITERFAFLPPKPPTYEIETVDVIAKPNGCIPYFIEVALGYSNPWTQTWTVLYSHGNAEDLGSIRTWCRRICHSLGVNVIGWDYPGYGCPNTTVTCSESACYEDFYRVYSWCLQQGISEDRLILWGKSIGTGIVIHQAAKMANKNRPLAGVILQSPFTSAVRVVSRKLALLPFVDIFDNISKIGSIEAPILFIHGDQDDIVDINHSHELLTKCRHAQLIELKGATHNNIESHYYNSVLTQIAFFLIRVEHTRKHVCPVSLVETPDSLGVSS